MNYSKFENRTQQLLKTSALLVAVLGIPSANGFLFSRQGVHPQLPDLAKSQEGTTLNIELEIPGAMGSLSRLCIEGLSLELEHTKPAKDHVPLPGANGDQPQLSTGPLSVKTLSEGRFISIDGQQHVPMEKGCWEMMWVDGRPTGSIVCGFDIPHEIKRNDAILPPGLMYLNFRIWTQQGLHIARNEKMAYERMLSKIIEEQKEELRIYEETANPVAKAMHFRNAVAANEKLDYARTTKFQTIPLDDKDVMAVGNDLVIYCKGSIWTKKYKTGFFGKKEFHSYLGSINLKSTD